MRRDPVEMISAERQGRDIGDDRGQQQGAKIERHPPPLGIVLPPPVSASFGNPLIGRDQRRDRREG